MAEGSPSDSPDGRELADRLARELADAGPDPPAVTDRRTTVDPTADGTLAYALALDGDRLAEVYVHPERLHLEFPAAPDRAAAAATAADLRVRPKAVRPPRTLVFVESPAQIERALDVVAAVAAAED